MMKTAISGIGEHGMEWNIGIGIGVYIGRRHDETSHQKYRNAYGKVLAGRNIVTYGGCNHGIYIVIN